MVREAVLLIRPSQLPCPVLVSALRRTSGAASFGFGCGGTLRRCNCAGVWHNSRCWRSDDRWRWDLDRSVLDAVRGPMNGVVDRLKWWRRRRQQFTGRQQFAVKVQIRAVPVATALRRKYGIAAGNCTDVLSIQLMMMISGQRHIRLLLLLVIARRTASAFGRHIVS